MENSTPFSFDEIIGRKYPEVAFRQMADIVELTKKVYAIQYDFSLNIAMKEPRIKPLIWPSWDDLPPIIRGEQIIWAEQLIRTGHFGFSPNQRHAFAVARRIENGWTRDDKLNADEKTYPYLCPMSECPEWFYEWCAGRDQIVIEHCKSFREKMIANNDKISEKCKKCLIYRQNRCNEANALLCIAMNFSCFKPYIDLDQEDKK